VRAEVRSVPLGRPDESPTARGLFGSRDSAPVAFIVEHQYRCRRRPPTPRYSVSENKKSGHDRLRPAASPNLFCAADHLSRGLCATVILTIDNRDIVAIIGAPERGLRQVHFAH